MFIAAFTTARHLPLSRTILIHSMTLHLTSRGSILILSSHLCLDIPSGLFPSGSWPLYPRGKHPRFMLNMSLRGHQTLCGSSREDKNQDLRFWQRGCRGRSVLGRVVSDVSKELITFIFSAQSNTQHCKPEDVNA